MNGNKHKITHDKLVKSALSRKGVREAYNALTQSQALLEEMLNARQQADKTHYSHTDEKINHKTL